MGRTVAIKNFTHDKPTVTAKAIWIWINRNRLEEAIRSVAGCLLRRGTIKGPLFGIFKLSAEIFDD
jgi:hypothetical protein